MRLGQWLFFGHGCMTFLFWKNLSFSHKHPFKWVRYRIIYTALCVLLFAGHGHGHSVAHWSRIKSALILLGSTVLMSLCVDILTENIETFLSESITPVSVFTRDTVHAGQLTMKSWLDITSAISYIHVGLEIYISQYFNITCKSHYYTNYEWNMFCVEN